MHGTGAAQAMTADEFFARARARLTLRRAGRPHRSEHHPRSRRSRHRSADGENRRGAADPPGGGAGADRRPPEPTVLLTQRAQHLPDHAGQISFPGGKIDKGDDSPLDAALREADEEIGLARDFVEPLGYLDLYMTTLRLPHPADGRAGQARLRAHAQHQRGGRVSRCRCLSAWIRPTCSAMPASGKV